MHLLVVEGNSKEIWSKREACGGIAYHKRFLSMLGILQPDATVDFAFPADVNTSLPSLHEIKKYNGIL